jgi:hypothetical protein
VYATGITEQNGMDMIKVKCLQKLPDLLFGVSTGIAGLFTPHVQHVPDNEQHWWNDTDGGTPKY